MRATIFMGGLLLAACAGCLGSADERSAFAQYAERFGATAGVTDPGSNAGGGGTNAATQTFRRSMTITVANTTQGVDLNIGVAAWVNTSSIRSADQQDALISAGFVQLTRETRIGDAFVLPPGTFVFNGGGNAGTTFLRVGPATTVRTERSIELITPDVVLFYMSPPTSCESPAFTFTEEGATLDSDPASAEGAMDPIQGFSASTGLLGIKTLGQIDAYQCDPFRPGLYLHLGGGSRQSNEYFEGNDIRIDCFLGRDTTGRFGGDIAAEVTIE
jgi:hypothetical protein